MKPGGQHEKETEVVIGLRHPERAMGWNAVPARHTGWRVFGSCKSAATIGQRDISLHRTAVETCARYRQARVREGKRKRHGSSIGLDNQIQSHTPKGEGAYKDRASVGAFQRLLALFIEYLSTLCLCRGESQAEVNIAFPAHGNQQPRARISLLW